MLSYQHAYHAGGPADIVKHALLSLLVARLCAKPAALTYAETHAGRGRYPLDAPETQKIGEYRHGLAKLWPRRHAAPPTLTPFLEVLADLTPRGEPSVYPGSPLLAASLLRGQDELHLCEKHPQEHAALAALFADDKRVNVYDANGPTRIPALPPVKNDRALVLVDPSYEVKTEYADTVGAAKAILHRWPKAVVMVWYPLLPDARHQPLADGLAALDIPATWRGELEWADPAAEGHRGAYGTGQIVLNMPFGLEGEADALLDWLGPVLAAAEDGWKAASGYVTPPR